MPASGSCGSAEPLITIEYLFNCLSFKMPAKLAPESAATVDKLAEVFHLLGEPNRLRIVLSCLDAPVSVQSLAENLQLSPSLASHHLRLLKAARLMRSERRGKQVFYQAADDHVRNMLADMVEHTREEEG